MKTPQEIVIKLGGTVQTAAALGVSPQAVSNWLRRGTIPLIHAHRIQGVGAIKGVLATLEIPFTPVSPSKWKKHFNLGKDKNESRAAATRLFPTLAFEFARKRDDGRAEAILIATWGAKQ